MLCPSMPVVFTYNACMASSENEYDHGKESPIVSGLPMLSIKLIGLYLSAKVP